MGSVDALDERDSDHQRRAEGLEPRVVVVTSAMSGVTNLLLDSATLAAQGKVDSLSSAESTLREKHFSLRTRSSRMRNCASETKAEINVLILSFVDLCKAIAVLGEASPRALDAVASLGERMSLRLLARNRQRRGDQSQGN